MLKMLCSLLRGQASAIPNIGSGASAKKKLDTSHLALGSSTVQGRPPLLLQRPVRVLRLGYHINAERFSSLVQEHTQRLHITIPRGHQHRKTALGPVLQQEADEISRNTRPGARGLERGRAHRVAPGVGVGVRPVLEEPPGEVGRGREEQRAHQRVAAVVEAEVDVPPVLEHALEYRDLLASLQGCLCLAEAAIAPAL